MTLKGVRFQLGRVATVVACVGIVAVGTVVLAPVVAALLVVGYAVETWRGRT